MSNLFCASLTICTTLSILLMASFYKSRKEKMVYWQFLFDFCRQSMPNSFRISSVMAWLFSFCTFGNSWTVRFCQLDGMIFEGPWYLLPIDMQKKLPLMIMVAQKPVYMKRFAEFQCTREGILNFILIIFSSNLGYDNKTIIL